MASPLQFGKPAQHAALSSDAASLQVRHGARAAAAVSDVLQPDAEGAAHLLRDEVRRGAGHWAGIGNVTAPARPGREIL